MEPLQLLRLLRRRWILLLLCAALGAALGYASTLNREEATGPVQSFWLAGQNVQISSPTSQAASDLERLAATVTKGTPAGETASALGIDLDEFKPTLRAVTDPGPGTMSISVVALSAEDARDRAQLLTDELDAWLVADRLERYETELGAAEDEAARRQSAVQALDEEFAELEDRVAAIEATRDAAVAEAEAEALAEGEDGSEAGASDDAAVAVPEPDPEDLARLSEIPVQREAEFQRLITAIDRVDELRREGPPQSGLIRLEPDRPIQISRTEYNRRVELGEQGFVTFGINEVGLAEGGGGEAAESAFDEPQTRAVAGGVAGLLLGMLAVLVHWRLDPRLRSREEAEAAFALPVVSEVPLMTRRDRRRQILHAVTRPRSIISESHRYLRSVLLYARGSNDHAAGNGTEGQGLDRREMRVVMVTSPGSGEGKTTTAANLAVVMAEAGYKTLLFNCDHRLPRAHQLLGCEYVPARAQKTDNPNLTFIADVKRIEGESPAEIAHRQVRVLERSREMFDVVIVDTAPLLATNDAVDLLDSTDLVVIVAREAKTTSRAAEETRELIDRIGTPIVGVVITCSGAGMGSRYYDKYRYGGYYGAKAAQVRPAPAKDAAAPKRRGRRKQKAAEIDLRASDQSMNGSAVVHPPESSMNGHQAAEHLGFDPANPPWRHESDRR